jgi:hypothetical protein
MKLTRETLTKAMTNAGVPSEHAKVMYNWGAATDLTVSEYDAAVSLHKALFNNNQDGLDHFFEADTTKLLTSSYPGISIASTDDALNDSTTAQGYGSFTGTDLIRISKDVSFNSWSVFINFEDENCPSDPSKRNILLSSTGTTATEGFNVGINGAKNLFYEFYDTNGVLRVYTILQTLNEKNIIAITKSDDLNDINIYIFNAVDLSVNRLSITTQDAQLGSKWCLGGVSPVPSAGDFNQMFEGKIYEFVLFSDSLSEEQVIIISKSLLSDDVSIEEYQTVTETYYATTGHSDQQVQVGTEITGYTQQATTFTNEAGIVMTLYDQVPVTSPIYQTQVAYTQDTNPSTRDVQQLVEASNTYDYAYIKDYASICFLLNELQSSATYEIYTSNQYTKNLGKKAGFVAGSAEFSLDEDYDNQKLVIVYVNGLLVEEGADYTRNGIIIKKYSGDYTEDDTLIYDVIDGGVQNFANFFGPATLAGDEGKDIYLDGQKLVYGQDYQDNGADLDILLAGSAGRMCVVSRHDDINNKLTGTIDAYHCFGSGQPIISEVLWIDGVRKIKNLDYNLNNPCDLANSNIVVPEKTTVIYENNESYFNI